MCCYRRLNQSVLIAYAQMSLMPNMAMCGSREGDKGSVPPWKITSYMHFPPGKSWNPPPPLENVGPPLDPWKSTVFSVIKPLVPLC